MKIKTNIKSIILRIICLLYVLLFVYVSISKLLDFENFQVQLGQSPLLSAFAFWVSWLVPIMELLIAFLLLISRFRQIGLIAALSLMSMFTAYIFIILHYSSFVPCSCGGVLEKMSWNVHLVFNLFFILLTIIGIVIQDELKKSKDTKSFKHIFISITSSVGVIIVLFLCSEEMIQHQNPFLRRYPQHPISLIETRDLKFNSYYFAGETGGIIYLGNYTDPLHVLSFDANLEHPKILKISFDPKKIPFKMVQVRVRGAYFYLIDGTVPAIFRGRTRDWKINKELKGSPYFTIAEPIDSTKIIFRANSGSNAANIIGIFTPERPLRIQYNQKLLQKQLDGVFDTDGMLLYDEKSKQMVYLYYYRNEFLVADQNTTLLTREKTIDTTSRAQIKVAYLKNGSERRMAAPPKLINAHAALYGNLLFIHSPIKGQYEDDTLWKQAFIIDLYNVEKGSYLMSFAIYGIEDKKLMSFFVTSTHLYAIIGDQLVGYELGSLIRKEISKAE